MIDYREEPGSNFAEIVVDGPISKRDFDNIAGRLTNLIEQQGSIGLLEDIRSIGKFDLSIIPADINFTFHHLKDISHCAIISERAWLEWLAKALDPLLSCEVRYFERGDIEVARAWLRESSSMSGLI